MRSVRDVRERLGRHRPDAGARPRHDRTDGEELRLDGDRRDRRSPGRGRRSSRSSASSHTRIRGSTMTWMMSTARLARTTHSVPNSTVPRISGTSAVTIESTASLPIPGHEKIRSTTTTPPRKKPEVEADLAQDRAERVAERVPPQDRPVADALGVRRPDVVPAAAHRSSRSGSAACSRPPPRCRA